MKIWISGCGGMMGSHLCEMLTEQGHEVLGTYYKPTIDASDLAGLRREEVDIRDWCSVYDSLARFQPEAVFHLAAQSYPTVSWARPVETIEANVIGTTNVFEAIRRTGAKPRVVVASSSAVYGLVAPEAVPVQESHPIQPLHPYGVTKVATEQLALQYWASYGIEAIAVRIFNCTGPRKTGDALSDFVRRVVWLERHPEQNGLRVGNLKTRRTIVDVRDLNRALGLLAERGQAGEIYNLGGSVAHAMEEILARVLAASTRTDLVTTPDPTLFRPTDEPVIWGDSSKLAQATGWSAEIPLERTVGDMFTYWRAKSDAAVLG